MTKYFYFLFFIILVWSCKSDQNPIDRQADQAISEFKITKDGEQLLIGALDGSSPLVIQNAQENHRPYLHPIKAPGTEVSLTQYSPDHHKHQTGLYWGFTRVNGSGADEATLDKWFYDKSKPSKIQEQIGRDFFHNPGEGYWKKIASNILVGEGSKVKWETVYHMLDAAGDPLLKERQVWTFEQQGDKHILSLDWNGEAMQEFTVNEFSYGGMFLRMPWKEGVAGEAINAARQKGKRAEGQRAMWVDVGMEIEGLDEWGHVSIFDHPDNDGFPTTWRVDGQLGVGPVRAGSGDWSIPKGETKTFRHQLLAYSGDYNDIDTKKLWDEFIGDSDMYNAASLWGIAQDEAKNEKFLSPQEAVDMMDVKEGYKANVFAAEPMITQPMAFCWDDKGRMWIAENRDYESRGDGFSNDGTSKILILEDTDNDGVVDTKKTFIENIPFPAAIAVGFDGVYIGAPPNLLYVSDSDGDDQADLDDVEVLLTGWGIRDRHETINSFHWGPDGWLYGLEGFATPSVIRKPVGKGRLFSKGDAFPEDLLEADGVDINGGVWRYHPTKDKFEVVAHGFSNPWGVDYDAKGQMFITACVIPHMFHIIPGGIYQRQGGRHFNPYVYEDIQTIVDHRHRSAHGGARIYQSDAFAAEEQGKLFMANIHEHAILSDVLKANGSGFTASHGDDFMNANNAQWIGFSMEVGPEGGLYVLDWHDGDICGKEVLHKETGRVFRIMPEKTNAKQWEGRYDDLRKLSDLELAELQTSKSNWHAQRARVILQNRAHKGSLQKGAVAWLEEILAASSYEDLRLRALWTLHITNHIDKESLQDLLGDDDQYVRAWAIQFVTEDAVDDPKIIKALEDLSRRESSPVVRMYLAAAMQRIPEDDRWQIAERLVAFSEDADDPNIPYMLWFGTEPIVTSDKGRALSLAKSSKIPMISRNIARRLVDESELEILTTALKEKSIGRKDMLEGMLAGLQGRTDLAEPAMWSSIYNFLKDDSQLAEVASKVNQQFGNVEAAKEMIAVLENSNSPKETKQSAIKSLASLQREELVALIPELLQNDDLRLEAIRSVASYDESKLGQILLDNYPAYSPTEKLEVVQTLSSRSGYGWQLASHLKDEKIPKSDIPAYVAMQLRRVVGNGFVEIWGPIDDISSNVKSDYLKYGRLLSEEAIANANVNHGQEVFEITCSACHKMHGAGGILGPDLTGSNRTNTTYLLNNILEPSSIIQDDYKMVVMTTQDGRTYSGNIIAENERQYTLRVVGQDELFINKSDVRSQEQTTKSMMPEGLLSTLTDDEIVDMIAYLKHLDPIGEDVDSD